MSRAYLYSQGSSRTETGLENGASDEAFTFYRLYITSVVQNYVTFPLSEVGDGKFLI